RHTSFSRDWSSDVCSSDLLAQALGALAQRGRMHDEHLLGAGRQQLRDGAEDSAADAYLVVLHAVGAAHRDDGRVAHRVSSPLLSIHVTTSWAMRSRGRREVSKVTDARRS